MKDKVIALFKDGFFHIMGGSVLIKLMGFISSIFVVRLITKEAYGCLAYADNLFSYVSIIGGLGMSTGIIIKCSDRYNEIDNSKYFKYALFRGSAIQLIGSMVVLLYFFAFTSKFRNASSIMIALCLYPTVSYIVQCVTNYVRAYQKNKLYSKAAVMQSLALLVASIILAMIIGVAGVVMARYIAIIVLLLILFRFLSKHVQFKAPLLAIEERKNFLYLSVSLLIASFFSELMYSNEMFLVNEVLSNEVITADYKVATLIPAQIMFVTQSLLIYFTPKFVQYRDSKGALWQYSYKVGLLNFVLICVVCFLAILLTPIIVKVLYGDAYIATIGLSIRFWITYGINAGYRMIPLNILASTGAEKINAVLSVVGCAVHFIIAYVTLEYIGLEALPIALSVVFILVGSVAWIALFIKCKKL